MAQQGEGRIYHFQTNCVLLGILFSRPYCWNSTFSKFFLVVHNHSCLCSCIRHFSAWFWLFAPLPYCFSEVSSHRPNIHFRIPGPIPCLYACILWCLSCLFFFLPLFKFRRSRIHLSNLSSLSISIFYQSFYKCSFCMLVFILLQLYPIFLLSCNNTVTAVFCVGDVLINLFFWTIFYLYMSSLLNFECS